MCDDDMIMGQADLIQGTLEYFSMQNCSRMQRCLNLENVLYKASYH